MKDNKENKDNSILINTQIRAPRLQVITHQGTNLGVIDRYEALKIAQEENLDLVLIAEVGKDGVPVAKIMDLGKALYKKKKDQGKKKQKNIEIKEIKMSPKIGEHDYQTKIKRAAEFLSEGKRVKISLFFRGRELATKEERGNELFNKIHQSLSDIGLGDRLIKEKDAVIGQTWSRVYYLK